MITGMDEIQLLRVYSAAAEGYGVVVDVGAFKGNQLVPFLKDGWSVYAVEPDPAKSEALAALAAQYPQMHVDRVALSSREGESIPFYTSKLSAGISSLIPFDATHTETTQVRVTTLRALFSTHGITQVDFLKIDAEGNDLEVLRGAPWELVQPRVIMCEFDESKKGCPRLAEIGGYLAERGYELVISEWYPISQYGAKHTWRKFLPMTGTLESEGAWGNVMAFCNRVDWLGFANALAQNLVENEMLLSAQGERLRKSRAEQQQKLELAEAELGKLRGSRLWRWTAPLRRMRGWQDS